jgi:hypothetical protein
VIEERGRSGRLKADSEVVAQVMGDDCVLVHLRTNDIFSLNATGASIWFLVAAGLSREEVAERLVEEYDIDLVAAQAEVRRLIGELQSHRLLIEEDAG